MLTQTPQMQQIPRLYVAIADGCHACAEAKPAIARVQTEHALDLLVVLLHVDRKDWSILGWEPNATPSYALVVDGRVIRKRVGAMDYKELVNWIAGRK